MPSINPLIFRAYDIRGKADTDITPEAARLIGQGFGTELSERYKLEHPRVVLGWDARTHSPAISEAAMEGLMKAGCHVLVMGQTPSPLNYFTTCERNLDGGVQITASHNPKEDNGLKLQIRDAEAYCGEDLQLLLGRIERGEFRDAEGSKEEIDAITPYHEFLRRLVPGAGQGLTVVVDNGNGVSGPAYNEALRQSGAEVIELFAEPDGTFPNHAADPIQQSTLVTLRETVKKQGAHFGIAFDGDGDRMGIVDETGAIRSADEVLLLLAKDMLTRHAGTAVVFTVSMSGILESELTIMGGKPVLAKVGHSFVEHAMREHQSLLGGEQSGHFFCAEDYYGYDDALVAALRLLSIQQKNTQPFSHLFADFPRVYQEEEIRPSCPDDRKFGVVRKVTEHFEKSYPVSKLDGVRVEFGSGAWAGIRASNTSPKLSICMEARSPGRLAEIKEEVLAHMHTYPEIDWH